MTDSKNAVVNSDNAVQKPVAKKAKPAGIRRVKHTGTASKYIASFNVPVGIEAGKAIKQAQGSLPYLKSTASLTVFGHKATTDNVKAMTAVIDGFLVNAAKNGEVDVKSLIDAAFNAYTTTSRCSHLPAIDQVLATYKKVADHLKTFDVNSGAYDRYLAKRLAKHYTAATGKKIAGDFSALAMLTRESVLTGAKAARAAKKAAENGK